MDTLTTVMQAFKTAFSSGTIAIKPMALGLYYSLLAIDFVWTMTKAAMQDGSNYLKIFVEKTMRYMIFLFLIKQYDMVFNAVVNSLITVGLTAGGSTLSASSFADPSLIFERGFTATEPILKFIDKMNPLALSMLGTFLLLAIVYLFIIVAFFIMSIQVFITYLEVYIVGTLAIYFLGCGVNKHTAFLAEKSIGAILSFAIKLMTLAFILSVANPILDGIVIEGEPDLKTYLKLLLGVTSIAFLCWQAPSLAAGLMAGSPSLSAGGVAGAAMASGAAAIGGAMAAMGGASMMRNILGGAASGGKTASEAIQAATAAGNGLTGQDGVFKTGTYDIASPLSSGPSSGQASNIPTSSGVSAANVAAKVDPSVAPSAPGTPGRATASSTETAATRESNTNTNQSGQTVSGADVPGNNYSGVSSVHQTGITPSEDAVEQTKRPMSAAEVAGRIALAQNAVAPEQSPSGGVGAQLQRDDE